MVLNNLPANLNDPNNFSIPYLIGHVHIDKALRDLSSIVNLMPYFIFKKLDLGALQPYPQLFHYN